MKSFTLNSLQHPLVKHWVKLRTDAAYRHEQKQLLLEGLKPVREVPTRIRKILYTEIYASQIESLPGERWKITEAILHKISGMPSPEGVVAEVTMPCFVPLDQTKQVLALDGVRDPGNLGTLLRTALAFGWETIYFLPGCCDPFNDKALRAARGAHFKLALSQGNAEELKKWVDHTQGQAWVADLQGKKPEEISFAPRQVLVLGNEAHGASEAIRRFCQPLTLSMPGEMESLNVAIAGGILLYLLHHHKD